MRETVEGIAGPAAQSEGTGWVRCLSLLVFAVSIPLSFRACSGSLWPAHVTDRIRVEQADCFSSGAQGGRLRGRTLGSFAPLSAAANKTEWESGRRIRIGGGSAR